MPKDPLLSEAFFTLARSASELVTAREESTELTLLVKQKLYPHLSSEQSPTYYQGAHNLRDLNQFVYQADSSAYSEPFKALQIELKISIIQLKWWADTHGVAGGESLPGFSEKLMNPTDGVEILYSDGKKLLEKVVVLLDETQINLNTRKNILVNLLADRELEKCVSGCYSRIASAALQLQENLEGPNQINQWLRSYSKELAKQVAATRPFAMPDTYQETICRASDCSFTQNMLHASNYLLMKAREQGYPIDIQHDPGAIELENRLSQLSKSAILDSYSKALERQITAKNLVGYLSEKLHESFLEIMSRDLGYVDKSTIILNKLNLVGEDSWFTTNKVGLEEIFSESGELKSVDALKITVTERLIQKNLLNAEGISSISLLRENLEYRRFFSAIELTWFWIDGERKSLLQLIKADRLPALISPLLRHLFIKDSQGLLAVMNHLPRKYDESFLHTITMESVVSFIKQSDSPQLFKQLLSTIPSHVDRALFLSQCGDTFVRKMLNDGMNRVDFLAVFPGLSYAYVPKDYDAHAIREGLSITRDLIKLVIANGFKNFNGMSFYRLNHLNYLYGIDFSTLNLQEAKFFQFLDHCNLDEAELKGAKFHHSVVHVSVKKTDLREVAFKSFILVEFKPTALEGAKLSTESFKDLILANNVYFIGADLREVNFQNPFIKNKLQRLDFSRANLREVDLTGVDLGRLMLMGADLEKANLCYTTFLGVMIDSQTNFKRSHLELPVMHYAYSQGVRNFDGCKIFLENFVDDLPPSQEFFKASFRSTEFIGNILELDITGSDLSGAKFTSVAVTLPEGKESTMLLSLRAKKSTLNEVLFRRVNFLDDTEFLDSTLKQLSFDEVKMSSKLLFEFYTAGQRDFKSVKGIKGAIQKKLMPFPVLDAELNKETFIHLYRQGLRDFRGSNLNSFYLGQALIEHAISEIELKLEGAHYKPSLLGCASVSRSKRVNDPSRCSAHLLIQKRRDQNENLVSIDDLEPLFQSRDRSKFILKELVLEVKPLFLLQNVDEIHFYWGYQADEASMSRSVVFFRGSTRESDRSTIQLNFHLSQRFENNQGLIEFAKNLAAMGVPDIKLNYYDEKKQYFTLHFFRDGMASLTAARERLGVKFRSILGTGKLDRTKIINQESYRDRLRRISLTIKQEVRSGVRAAGRKGAYFQVGAGVVHLVGRSLYHPKTLEPKVLDDETKEDLKNLATNVTLEIGRTRGASDRQIEMALNLTKHCIDRGECSNEELVIGESMYFLYSMRPDIVVGNTNLLNDVKDFFVNVGAEVANKFNEIKEFFKQIAPSSRADLAYCALPVCFFSQPGDIRYLGYPPKNKHKRRIPTWYQSPLLIRLIKEIEAGFDALDYDLQRDDRYSEEISVGILYDIWQGLGQRNISSHSDPEVIANILLDNTFIETIVNGSSLINPITHESSFENSLETSNRRTKRSTSLVNTQHAQETRIEDMADDYLFSYQHPKMNKRPVTQLKVSLEEKKKAIKFVTMPKLSDSNHPHTVSQKTFSNAKKSFAEVAFEKSLIRKASPPRCQRANDFKQAKPEVSNLGKPTQRPINTSPAKLGKTYASLPIFRQELSYSRLDKPTNYPLLINEDTKLTFTRTRRHQYNQPNLPHRMVQANIDSMLFVLDTYIRRVTNVKHGLTMNRKIIRQQERVENRIEKTREKIYRYTDSSKIFKR